MRNVARVALLLTSILMMSPVAHAQKRVALVIGNSTYQHTPALTNPKHDAVDVAAVLKGLGFHTIEGFDLSKTEMERAIRDFAQALSGAQIGLLFYAGHGLQVGGENYLVPVDAELVNEASLDFEMIRLAVVHRVMERATETNVIFLDACRDNPLARNLARAMGTRSSAIGRGLAPVESGVGTLISFSTQPGNVALDGSGRNSPFAGALVEHLATSREDLSTILIGVRNRVMAETSNRQVPWEHSALRARFYVHGVQGDSAVSGTPVKLNEAAQVWSSTKDTTSDAVLKAFIARYEDTVFSELARARLRELEDKQRQKAIAASSRDEGATVRVGLASTFDGAWEVTRTGDQSCRNKSGKFQFRIENGVVAGRSILNGSVTADGNLAFDVPAPASPDYVVRFTGKLSGPSGRGTFQTRNHPCAGTAVFKRLLSESR